MTDIDDLARFLRDELAEMASTASVNMTLWDKFSNRVLSAAHTLEQQEKAIKRLNQMCNGYRDGAKEAGVLIDERDARISELESALKPFAEEAKGAPDVGFDYLTGVRFSDLRHAYTVLNKTK